MSSGQLFVLVIGVPLLIAITLIAFSATRSGISQWVVGQMKRTRAHNSASKEPQRSLAVGESPASSEEQRSKAELERLQRLIEDRKRIAWETDICYHLWGLYERHFRFADAPSSSHHIPVGEWYDLKILKGGSRDGLNQFEFELKGNSYKFVDDEEKQGWRENLKFFSLSLYDDSDRCLIEIPMRMRVDRWGRDYAILSDGPKAFLPDGWINDFINVTLKRQSIHNQEIRAQKHQDRLREIEDLKARFGISD